MSTLSGVQQSGGESTIEGAEEASDVTHTEAVVDQPSASGSEESESLSENDIFELLRNSRRRTVISYLLDEREASVKELTRQVGAEEYDIGVDELSPDQHKRVYTGLYQCHLPRLDDAGVVRFDKDTKMVTIRESATRVERYLDRGESSDAAYGELIGAVTVASVVTLGILGVGPLGAVSATAWAVFTVIALLGFALFQVSMLLNSSRWIPTVGWET